MILYLFCMLFVYLFLSKNSSIFFFKYIPFLKYLLLLLLCIPINLLLDKLKIKDISYFIFPVYINLLLFISFINPYDINISFIFLYCIIYIDSLYILSSYNSSSISI